MIVFEKESEMALREEVPQEYTLRPFTNSIINGHVKRLLSANKHMSSARNDVCVSHSQHILTKWGNLVPWSWNSIDDLKQEAVVQLVSIEFRV